MLKTISVLALCLPLLGGLAHAQATVSHELAFEAWAEDVAPTFAGSSLSSFADYVEHDVLAIRIEYQTTYRMQQVTASGLIAFPMDLEDLEDPAPVVVWAHGTLFDENGAPSSYGDAHHLGLVPALGGMITLLPDYTGYGSSADLIHPYIMRDDLVHSVIDMIHAARDVLAREDVPCQDEVMLWGFSEGGFVALAVAQELEANAEHGLTLAETHAVSGPYSLLESANVILEDETYPIPAYVAYLFASYNDRYWQRPLTEFFVAPYADIVERFQRRKIGLGQLARSMPDTLGALVKPEFVERYRTAGEEARLKASLDGNSVPPFGPRAPVFLHHGTADRDVPIAIAQRQFAAMMEAGADPELLTLATYEGLNHGQTAYRALRVFLDRHR